MSGVARARIGALAVLALAAASSLGAQSITSLRGLGDPMVPADARTDILGGIGVGLQGLTVTLTDPAAAAGLRRRGAVVTVAAVERTSTLGEASEASGSTRFPLIRLLYPIGDVVMTAGYGGYLDQSWAMTRSGTGSIGSGTVGFTDLVRSTGGIGQAQVGAAVPLGSRFAVGAAVGLHTGSQTLEFRRLFDTTSVGFLQPFREVRSVRYSGPMAQAGLRWDPIDEIRLGASVTWAGTLEADSTGGPAASREYALPLQVAGGASAYLAPSLLAAFSARWSGWSETDPRLAEDLTGTAASSRDTWELGGGLELDDPARRAARSFPIRVGVQYRQLPFTFVTEAPTEWVVGGGVGMRLGVDPMNPLARVDLTVQRGERTAVGDALTGDLSESMWRFALSVALFGN